MLDVEEPVQHDSWPADIGAGVVRVGDYKLHVGDCGQFDRPGDLWDSLNSPLLLSCLCVCVQLLTFLFASLLLPLMFCCRFLVAAGDWSSHQPWLNVSNSEPSTYGGGP